jgi:hypothetical protein
MNRKGGAVQFAILVFLIALVTYLVYYLPGVDISKPIVEQPTLCKLSIQNNSAVFVEGENGVITATLYAEVGGVYTVSFDSAPNFASTQNTLLMSAGSSVQIEIIFTNATPAEKKDSFVTSWDDAKLIVSGPTECRIDFYVSIIDNCPSVYNSEQTDSDSDGTGDACDNQTCNNSICESGENLTNCCNDCGCLPGQMCVNNNCTGKPFACILDTDCNDYITCTRDVCYHRNSSASFCGHLELTKCSEENSDGCCPEGCNGNTDIDCEADCGNGICEDVFNKEAHGNCDDDCPPEED